MRRAKKTSRKMSAEEGLKQIVTNYEKFDFTPGKVNGKRVAFCNRCHMKLCNTGINRLKKHRLACKQIPCFVEVHDNVQIKTEKTAEDADVDIQVAADNLSDSSDDTERNLEKLLQDVADDAINSIKSKRVFEHDECTDTLFMKSMLGLMRDLPLNMKDNFQAVMYQEVYKLRAQARKKRRL